MSEKTAGAAELRNGAVDELVKDQTIVIQAIEDALRKVPRHLAVPEATLEAAYSPYDAVVTKWDERGIGRSSMSAMQIQAMQLEQARIRPGDRGVEIGSGGVNAAYIAELTGEGGEMTTVDIDPFVTGRAESFLKTAGYPQVRVLLADAEEPLPV